MKIPLTRPLTGPEELAQVSEVLASGMLTQGPKVSEFETNLAAFIGAPHVIAVSSATTALHLAMILGGIKPGDEVIVPSYTFIATANAVLYVGATPVFADIDPQTFNLDVTALHSLVTPRTRAVVTVDQFGLPSDLGAIGKFCEQHNLLLLEDAACSLGAEYHGRKLGSFGGLVAFSFHPRKSISTGEGGALITDNSDWADRARVLRAHGMEKAGSPVYQELGYNYRLSDLQAAVGVAQLHRLPDILLRRRSLADRYNNAFKEMDGIATPSEPANTLHTYQTYALKVKHRSPELIRFLSEHGIASRGGIAPIHQQKFMRPFVTHELPHTERVAQETVVLPLFPQMTESESNFVIDRVTAFAHDGL